jgi:hypothetical protein
MTETTTERGLSAPRWLVVLGALGLSLVAVAFSYGGLPGWLAVVPAGYLAFAAPGVIAGLSVGPHLRGVALLLMTVALSLVTVVLAGVLLDLLSIRVTGRAIALMDLGLQLVIVAGVAGWKLRVAAPGYWAEPIDLTIGHRFTGIAGWWPRGVIAGLSVLVLIGSVVIAVRGQHRQPGVTFSTLQIGKGDPALTGELAMHPLQRANVTLELDTQADVRTAEVSATVDSVAGPVVELHSLSTGQLVGTAQITAPARVGRFQVVLSTPNPTYVASPQITDPATVTGPEAEQVDSAPLLQLVIWVNVT